jgi:hypothetical protein
LWCGETYQCLNISTHPLRLDTAKEKKQKKNERKDKRKRNNDHPLELNIPKCDQPKHPKTPKETSLKANQDPRI